MLFMAAFLMGSNLHLFFLRRMLGEYLSSVQCWQSQQALLKPFLAPGIGSEGSQAQPSSRPGRGLLFEGEP